MEKGRERLSALFRPVRGVTQRGVQDAASRGIVQRGRERGKYEHRCELRGGDFGRWLRLRHALSLARRDEVLGPAIFDGDARQLGVRISLQAARGGCVNFSGVLAEKLERHVSVDLSSVVRPLVQFVLRNETLPRRLSVAHAELDAFEHRGDAVGNWFPGHVGDGSRD